MGLLLDKANKLIDLHMGHIDWVQHSHIPNNMDLSDTHLFVLKHLILKTILHSSIISLLFFHYPFFLVIEVSKVRQMIKGRSKTQRSNKVNLPNFVFSKKRDNLVVAPKL